MRPRVLIGAMFGGVIGVAIGPISVNTLASQLRTVLGPTWQWAFTLVYLASLPLVAIGVVGGAWLADRAGRK